MGCGEGAVSELPAFYCTRTLLGFHPEQDINRMTLNGPGDWRFVLYEMGEPRDQRATQRANQLAAALTKLWEAK